MRNTFAETGKRRKRNFTPGPLVQTWASSMLGKEASRAVKGKSKWAKARNRNPELDMSGADEMSRQFHGREPRETIEVIEKESYDPAMACLAELEELGVIDQGCKTRHAITFKRNRPNLASDESGDNLEIIGGDQHLDLEDTVGTDYKGKRMYPLGYVYQIVYETDKHHLEGSKGYSEPYEHFFGEEYYKEKGYNNNDFENSDDYFDELLLDGVVKDAIREGYLPMLVYNDTDSKLLLIGGRYIVKDVGIKD
jgi:hypothetical protein